LINESDKLFITVLLLQIKRNKGCDVHFSLHDKISYEILKSSNHIVPLIAVASKCYRQENEIDESNVSKEDIGGTKKDDLVGGSERQVDRDSGV
jgi:hypothetical protein